MKYWKKGRSVSASNDNDGNSPEMDQSPSKGHSRNNAGHSWKNGIDPDSSSRSLSTVTGLRPRPTSDTPRLTQHHKISSVSSPGIQKKDENDIAETAVLKDPDDHTELLQKYTNSILSPCLPDSADKLRGLTLQHILVCNNYYFRLVHESYEQLQTLHYRASLEFSLAEWMHIHSLMLYSRIQRVRQSFKPTNGENEIDFSDWNLINLDSDALVFSPIATALSAIGAVEDKELGVLYIPDAIFPSSFNKTGTSSREFDRAELSSLEVKHILNGTLYDWQRSWSRVLEYREKRVARMNSRSKARSTSELIAAIQETTRSISRMRQLASTISPNTEVSSSGMSSSTGSISSEDTSKAFSETTTQVSISRYDTSAIEELNQYERQLTELIEEARNAKDYTVHPPCDGVFDWSCMSKRQRESVVEIDSVPACNQAMALTKEDSDITKKVSMVSLGSRVVDRDSPQVPNVVPTKFLHRRITTNELESQLVGLINAKDYDNKPDDHNELNRRSGNETQQEIDLKSSLTSSFDSTPSEIDLEFTLDYTPEYSIQPSEANEYLCCNQNAMENFNIDENCNQTESLSQSLPPKFPFHAISGAQTSSLFLSDIRAPQPPKGATVVAGSDTPRLSCAMDLRRQEIQNSIPCDSQLWKDYKRFVERLRERQRPGFEVIKPSIYGSHAWVLKVNMPKRRSDGDHRPQLIMPRLGILPKDQVLSLILQTSYPGKAISQSWHVHRYAEVDVPKLLHEYVKAAINDRNKG